MLPCTVQGRSRMLGWLSLAYNDIGAVGSHWIGSALESGSHLRILNLSWNPQIGQDGLERLAQSLLNNSLLEVCSTECPTKLQLSTAILFEHMKCDVHTYYGFRVYPHT